MTKIIVHTYICIDFSRACGFADEDNYIITGGDHTMTTVSRYDRNGWIEDLPSLNGFRWGHACGTYLDTNNNRVSSK